MNVRRRFLCFALAMVMSLTLCTTAFAMNENANADECVAYDFDGVIIDDGIIYQVVPISMEEAAEVNRVDDGVILKGPQYQYKTEYLPDQTKVLEGEAGDNNPEGDRFATGGGFYFSDSGGPTAYDSISINISGVIRMISIGISLGKSSSSGKFVTVPRTDAYYKLYVEKTVKVHPYVTYQRPSGAAHADEWTVYTIGATQTVIDVNQYAKFYKWA
ncbi:MAG: hypothetical protein VB023_03870 [Oscillibacter sp.]|nr:hypothetical protein [Oscillibacter sp.]